MTLLSLTAILFLIMDPFGNASYFDEMLSNQPGRKKIALRELGFALVAMLFFYFVGDILIDMLAVSDASVSITSGLILFLVAVKILFPTPTSGRIHRHQGETPFVVPLAIPLVAGPSLLATIMLFSHQFGPVVLLATLLSWMGAGVLLFFSDKLLALFGKNGLLALEKLMGMILVLLAVQRLLEGLSYFSESL